MAAKADGPEPDSGLRTDFERSVNYLVTALSNKLCTAASHRLRRRLKIGLMEWRVIALLAVDGEATPGRIAQVAGVDKSVVSRAVTSLAKLGLVHVAGTGGSGRQTLLLLTDAGWATHERGIVESIAAEQRLLRGFTPAEHDAAVLLLKRLAANVARGESADPA